MATFTYTPSVSSQVRTAPRSLKARFGDGYSQRAADGINANPTKWNVVFSDESDTDADAIIAFFDARNGHESFTWTPPGGSAGQYTIVDHARRYVRGLDRNTITAQFEQEFEA